MRHRSRQPFHRRKLLGVAEGSMSSFQDLRTLDNLLFVALSAYSASVLN